MLTKNRICLYSVATVMGVFLALAISTMASHKRCTPTIWRRHAKAKAASG